MLEELAQLMVAGQGGRWATFLVSGELHDLLDFEPLSSHHGPRAVKIPDNVDELRILAQRLTRESS